MPALILLDVNLPGVDGYEVVAILKSFPTLATTPVIAVTAYAMEGDRQRTLVAGCDGYIQKPIDVDAFPRQVAEFLGGKRGRVESRDEGVFLRVLEYFNGLLFLTTNRVDDIDEAIVSRCIALIRFHPPSRDDRSKIWRVMGEQFGLLVAPELLNQLPDIFPEAPGPGHQGAAERQRP